ncbi:MAG TPA: cytochrome c [Bryobacteraceae bacterium]|jgi:mono/diheme cytochrome c family protein|nr:cytochrome c [Bryobacteraceae bacterium]
MALGRAFVLLVCLAALAASADHPTIAIPPGLKLASGKRIWETACAACHGSDGKGTPKALAGFDQPRTFPDFTRCDQTTSELDNDYRAIITNGGPFRGFSQIMPAFRQALTPKQINQLIEYLRGFCDASGWPRGELNLPRALVTEKAFPENETVLTSALNAGGAPGVANDIIEENRFGKHDEIEIDVPVNFIHPEHTWYGGFGDASLGLKHEFFSNSRTGSIFAAQGEIILPTGSTAHGIGSGTPSFATFAAFDQLFPTNTFFQVQAGTQQPFDTSKAPRTFFWYNAVGQELYQSHGLGRMWSPMVEFLADRDFLPGAKMNWDVMPEMQVTVSRRQHIRFDVGVRIPATNTAGRDPQVLFYVLWDWQDGRLTEGW